MCLTFTRFLYCLSCIVSCDTLLHTVFCCLALFLLALYTKMFFFFFFAVIGLLESLVGGLISKALNKIRLKASNCIGSISLVIALNRCDDGVTFPFKPPLLSRHCWQRE